MDAIDALCKGREEDDHDRIESTPDLISDCSSSDDTSPSSSPPEIIARDNRFSRSSSSESRSSSADSISSNEGEDYLCMRPPAKQPSKSKRAAKKWKPISESLLTKSLRILSLFPEAEQQREQLNVDIAQGWTPPAETTSQADRARASSVARSKGDELASAALMLQDFNGPATPEPEPLLHELHLVSARQSSESEDALVETAQTLAESAPNPEPTLPIESPAELDKGIDDVWRTCWVANSGMRPTFVDPNNGNLKLKRTSGHLRMLAIEQQMMQELKITHPLKERECRQCSRPSQTSHRKSPLSSEI